MANQDLTLTLLEFNPVQKELDKMVNHVGDKLFKAALENSTHISWITVASPVRNGNSYFAAYTTQSDIGCNVVCRGYPSKNLLCIDIQQLTFLKSDLVFHAAALEKFSSLTCAAFSCELVRVPSIIPRGYAPNNLLQSSDQRLLVYDFDEVIVDRRSELQHVQIFHSKQFGNTLVLDGFVNLAESDLVYTHTFMRKGKETYAGSDILILGGGDGALLKEVLAENPNFVTMVDVDEVVLDVCKKYMRSCCGDALDSFDGPNHKIIIADCFPVIEELIASGRTFDYVFSDLTDVPVVTDGALKQAEFWELMIRVLERSLRLLKPSGKLLTHLVGVCSPDVIAKYENILCERNLVFEKTVEMVPSFLESWVFYSVINNNPSA